MESTASQQLLDINTISSAFKHNQQDISNQIITYFYSCYRPLFIKWAKITYTHYPADTIEFAADNAFTDAVLKLKEAAVRDELYQSNASVKTILFHYCRNMLLGHLTNEKRQAEKNRKLQSLFSDETGYTPGESEEEVKEQQHRHIMQALAKMPDADRQIIQWRHIEERSPDEIAILLAIKVPSATNRIYRCMQRLKEMVEEMNK
ncbi:MAG: sigma-70 family RNA polymerase sigma factor [Agriterribacter sp.]